ncbi:MAG: hydrogenase maturation protease [Pseudomonadota bacterium]
MRAFREAIMREGALIVAGGDGVRSDTLYGDDGFGAQCVETLLGRYLLPRAARVFEAGAEPGVLVDRLAEAERIIIFDAVDFGAEPGSLTIARRETVPALLEGRGVGGSDMTLSEALSCATLTAGGPPAAVTLIGCQPAPADGFGGGLSRTAATQVGPAVEACVLELALWECDAVPMGHAAEGVAALLPLDA